jgi:hypothetical protein
LILIKNIQFSTEDTSQSKTADLHIFLSNDFVNNTLNKAGFAEESADINFLFGKDETDKQDRSELFFFERYF